MFVESEQPVPGQTYHAVVAELSRLGRLYWQFEVLLLLHAHGAHLAVEVGTYQLCDFLRPQAPRPQP